MDWGGGVTRRVHLQVWKKGKKNWQCLFLWEEGGEIKESFLWTLIEKRYSLRFDHFKRRERVKSLEASHHYYFFYSIGKKNNIQIN